MNKYLFFLLAPILCGCVTVGAQQRRMIDTVQMYGGMDRSAYPELAAADKTLVDGTTKEFGSRRKASQQFVEVGLKYYREDNIDDAMRRINQAWLIDPENPEVYYGFAVLSAAKGIFCDGAEMVQVATEKGLSFGPSLADSAWIVSKCAQSVGGELRAERPDMVQLSAHLFAEAVKNAPNNPYVYWIWAQDRFLQEDYAFTWRLVSKMEELEYDLPVEFLSALEARMPKPKS